MKDGIELIRQLMIMAKDKLYSCCPPETVSFYWLSSENAVWPLWTEYFPSPNIFIKLTEKNVQSSSQPDKVSSIDLIMDLIKYLQYFLSCLYQIYHFWGFQSTIEQELDSLQTPRTSSFLSKYLLKCVIKNKNKIALLSTEGDSIHCVITSQTKYSEHLTWSYHGWYPLL